MTTEIRYQHGFGNALSSEAVDGAIPELQNAPNPQPLELHAEQINGTGFTVRRDENQRTWMYRLRPQIQLRPWTEVNLGRFAGRFDAGRVRPGLLRYRAPDLPDAGVSFVEGVTTFGGAGDPALKAGMAIHLYAATADMADTAFVNNDGDFLFVPEHGRLRIQTELGWLEVAPGEIAILPRGIRFRVEVPDGAARGFVSELFEGHLQLPDRGLIGANGLADERHFRAPVADFEDRAVSYRIITKQGGSFWGTTQDHSPFDVVGWHGTYAPFVYDLMQFQAFGSVTWDHPDPSVLTVLTAPHDTRGRNVLDFAVFRGRWDATEHTFRPPYLHRNSAVEFNAVIKTPADSGPYQAGAITYTPYLQPHGVSAKGTERELAREDDSPHRLPDDELWIQWESTYQLKVMPWMLDHPARDHGYVDQFQDYPVGEVG